MVTLRAAPAIGGVESLLRDVARGLAARHDVTVIALRTDDGPWRRERDATGAHGMFEPFSDDGVRVVPLDPARMSRPWRAPLALQNAPPFARFAFGRSRIAYHYAYAKAAAGAIRAAEPGADVVHAWTGELLGSAARRAARLGGAPFVVSPFMHRGQWGDDPGAAGLYRRSDRVVALLEADAEQYRQLGVARERVVTAGSCSDGVRPGSMSMRARHGIDGPLAVFLGVRRAYKGADLLLQAAPIAARSLPGVTIAFVGPGEPLQPPEGVRVIDAGEVSAEERGAWLDAADVMCLPSAAEIFPLTILEAWSVSTPVIVSDIAPLRELIAMSGGGISTTREPSAIAEALVTLLRREDCGRALGERGRALWEERYTTEAIVARHEEIYDEVLGR